MQTSNAIPEGVKPLIASDDELYFQSEMFREYEAGNLHSFILYFNIHDYVFVPSFSADPDYFPIRLRDYLGQLLLQKGFEVVIYYSLAGGLGYLKNEMSQLIVESIPEKYRHSGRYYGQDPKRKEQEVPASEECVLALSYLDRLLTYSGSADGNKDEKNSPRIAVILEYLESLAPHEDSHQRSMNAGFVVQMLHRWAMDRRLRKKHIIVGLAADLGNVSSTLYAATSECRSYKVDLPIEEIQSSIPGLDPRRQRRDWLKWVIQGLEKQELLNPLSLPESIESLDELASQSSGFNYDNLRDIVYYTAKAGQALKVDSIQQRKREIITAQSRDLLEIVEPRYGFDVVAGYQYVKDYLQDIKDAILKQGSDPVLARMVPKGILFLGPPGTGKSFMATALAKETGFNMVKFKNIRSMWVGESERNLNRVLDLLSAMHPVIVFIDEVDAALGMRSSGGGDGGSGVEQRIFQRMLEYMAQDDNRGKVLWIAASNRPDKIDPALLSRFDLVMPLLLPDDEARRAMLKDAYPEKIQYNFDQLSKKKLDECVSLTVGFSGRELDTICRRALQMAGEERLKEDTQVSSDDKPTVSADHILAAMAEFRQARDPDEYELQTLVAIQTTNFISFLPKLEELPENIRSDGKGSSPLDEQRLHDRINELRTVIGRRRMVERGLIS